MNITLSRSSLLTATQQCQSIVEKRHSKPILANLLLVAEQGQLTVVSTDTEVGISHTTSAAEIQSEGATTVSAKKMFDIIKELDPDKPIRLQSKSGFVSIQSGRSRFKVNSLPADGFPNMPVESCDSTISISGLLLSDMIASTAYAISTDETRKYLTGLLFELGEDQMLRLVSTDGHRLSLSEIHLEQPYQPQRCIVPRKAIVEMRKLCENCPDQIELSLGERQVRLVAGENFLTSKLIDARYPSFRDVIPVNHPTHILLPRLDLDQALRRTLIMANELTHDVCFVFRDNLLEISAHNTEHERAEEQLAIEYHGGEVMIGFNGRYLRDALNAISTEMVVIEMRDELSPILIYGENHPQSKHIVMPLRITS